MKFYLASGLENAEKARFFRNELVREGLEQTYDWTVHGAVAGQGVDRIREVAEFELRGVERADFVLVVLPGGKGTHFEMGAAFAYGRPVFLYSPDRAILEDHPQTCAFYHLPGVKKFSGHPETAVTQILEAVREMFGHV